jgi:hypothetical protein
MRILIEPKTAAATSEQFTVRPGQSVAIVSNGLADDEEVRVQVKNASGTFDDVDDTSAVMTATARQCRIVAAGDYRVDKDETDAESGVAMGEIS